MIRRPPRSTLFPYTTLFRSRKWIDFAENNGGGLPEFPLPLGEQSHACGGDIMIEKLMTPQQTAKDRKSTRLNSSHSQISYAVFCLKKKKTTPRTCPRAGRRP